MRWAVIILAMAGCAEGTVETGEVGGMSGTAGSGMGMGGSVTTQSGGFGGAGAQGGGGGSVTPQSCPAGEFATGLVNGVLECATIDATMSAAIHGSCTITAGWADECGAPCPDAPDKWGRVSGAACTNGVGTDYTCQTLNLGGETVRMFGVNTDGDVNGDDRFYLGLSCDPGMDMPAAGPCTPGEIVVGIDGNTAQCLSLQAAAASYVNASCSIYYGHRDQCGSCGLEPARWGSVSATACSNGTGSPNNCTMPTLGGSAVHLFGLQSDGDVNDDDKFYYGMHCAAATDAGGPADETCPAGQLVVGINGDGTIECASPAPVAQSAFESTCFLYAGWSDTCDGCTGNPDRWGRVRVGACENGVGTPNTCTTESLGAPTVNLFGLSTNGEVNGDDTFYVGLHCL